MMLLITQFEKKNSCGLKPADNSNKAKEKKGSKDCKLPGIQ